MRETVCHHSVLAHPHKNDAYAPANNCYVGSYPLVKSGKIHNAARHSHRLADWEKKGKGERGKREHLEWMGATDGMRYGLRRFRWTVTTSNQYLTNFRNKFYCINTWAACLYLRAGSFWKCVGERLLAIDRNTVKAHDQQTTTDSAGPILDPRYHRSESPFRRGSPTKKPLRTTNQQKRLFEDVTPQVILAVLGWRSRRSRKLHSVIDQIKTFDFTWPPIL